MNSATILCYHKVGPASEEGRRLNIEPSRLRSHVHFFARRNRPFLVAGDLSGAWPTGIVCFTFDDAYESTMVHAPGIFEEHGVRATFYAVPSKVGGASDWDDELARPLAKWDLLREVEARGHEIGNHSLSHLRMADLAENQQLSEVAIAHDQLRSERLNPRSFCYPYGSHSDVTIQQLRKTGYSVGLALDKRIAYEDDNKLAIPRIVVAYSDALPMLLYKLLLKPILKGQRR